MRRSRILAAAVGAAALATPALVSAAHAAPAPTTQTEATSYVVLADEGADTGAVAQEVEALGAKVTGVNKAVGMLTATSTRSDFAASARRIGDVTGVARDRSIGSAPDSGAKLDPIEKEHVFDKSRANGTGKTPPPPAGHDPLDGFLWGLDMINAFAAHGVQQGDPRVTVGVLDTGIQGDHPDLAPNFDAALSRNFTTDMTDVDGACEYADCKDPAGWDDNGHGTHVAGTIAAALNGMGVSGIAPKVRLVNIRGGQDSGYFFLDPVVNALTYAGDAGIDVVNMSFYVDPWLYNCVGGAPEDSPEAAAEQETIITAMNRALDYAHGKGVTLVGALGNDHDNLSNPRHDFSSPDYGPAPYERTIDNATCFDMPTEGHNVIGVSSLGPSGTKSDFSNYATDLGSGEIEVSAPGGWYRDFFGTARYRTNGNLILSTAPTHVLQAEGSVDKNGNVTKAGRLNGVLKQCGADGCGYYQWLQGTSMAAPHATGVAALAVSAHGSPDADPARGLTLAPDTTGAILAGTATDHACPEGGTIDYLDEGRSAEFTATCVGDAAFNGFYGAGIVNALGVVQ